MGKVKSDILKELSNSYPNFLKKDLNKLIDILIDITKNSLKKKERVELRDIFMFEPKTRSARISRNPKTNEKVKVPEKTLIRFKVSKKWSKIINEKV